MVYAVYRINFSDKIVQIKVPSEECLQFSFIIFHIFIVDITYRHWDNPRTWSISMDEIARQLFVRLIHLSLVTALKNAFRYLSSHLPQA